MARQTEAHIFGNFAILLLLAVAVSCPGLAEEPAVRIRVFSLFHPQELRVGAPAGCSLAGNKPGTILIVQLKAGHLAVSESGDSVEPPTLGVLSLRPDCPGKPSSTAEFWLEVPGKLRRTYQGSLEIHPHGQALEAIVTMPLETAVASVVAAESLPALGQGSNLEALKAQAVAARSFFLARQAGHIGFDFCDTTHCQFLRSPPAPESRAAKAAQATQSLILTWHDPTTAQDRPLAAMYARSCGGRTRTLREIGLPVTGYPYYSVHCRYCARHPELWRREASPAELRTERDRLLYNRIHGWAALPSLPNQLEANANVQEGRGTGHGLGLCQLGAADMARHGADFRQILVHYYPNTRLESAPPASNRNIR